MACRGPWHYGIVPFHLGKHKPVAPPKRAAFGLKLRLQVAALGALAVAIGMFQISRAVLFVIDLHGMEAYSAGCHRCCATVIRCDSSRLARKNCRLAHVEPQAHEGSLMNLLALGFSVGGFCDRAELIRP
jgi:hypothetical protein